MTNQFPAFDHEALQLNSCFNAASTLSRSLLNNNNEDRDNTHVLAMLEEIFGYSHMLKSTIHGTSAWSIEQTYDEVLNTTKDKLGHISPENTCTLNRRLRSLTEDSINIALEILSSKNQVHQNIMEYLSELCAVTALIIRDGCSESSLLSEFKCNLVETMSMKLEDELNRRLLETYAADVYSMLQRNRCTLKQEMAALESEIEQCCRKLYQLQEEGPDHKILAQRYQQILDQKDLLLDDISRLSC